MSNTHTAVQFPRTWHSVDALLASSAKFREALKSWENTLDYREDEPLSAHEIGRSMGLGEDRVIEVIRPQNLRQLRELDSANELGRKVA